MTLLFRGTWLATTAAFKRSKWPQAAARLPYWLPSWSKRTRRLTVLKLCQQLSASFQMERLVLGSNTGGEPQQLPDYGDLWPQSCMPSMCSVTELLWPLSMCLWTHTIWLYGSTAPAYPYNQLHQNSSYPYPVNCFCLSRKGTNVSQFCSTLAAWHSLSPNYCIRAAPPHSCFNWEQNLSNDYSQTIAQVTDTH